MPAQGKVESAVAARTIPLLPSGPCVRTLAMPTIELALRPFCLEDAGTVAPWLVGPGLSLPPGTARRQWAQRLVADERVEAWVAAVAGEPVAFVRLDIGPDRIAELTLAVAPLWQRRGIGTATLAQVLTKAHRRRIRRLHAVVDLANAPALAFFSRVGFEDGSRVGDSIRFVRWLHEASREVLEIEG